jgi:hypothetical protein
MVSVSIAGGNRMSRQRRLVFRSGQEVIDEIVRLRDGGYTRSKNWSLTQICDHIAKTIDIEMRGGLKQLPWIARKLVGEPLAKWMLRYDRSPTWLMIPAPRLVRPAEVAADADDPATIEGCIEIIRMAEMFPGPVPSFPFADDISVEDWRRLNWIHAAHHLGYLLPRDSAADERRGITVG